MVIWDPLRGHCLQRNRELHGELHIACRNGAQEPGPLPSEMLVGVCEFDPRRYGTPFVTAMRADVTDKLHFAVAAAHNAD